MYLNLNSQLLSFYTFLYYFFFLFLEMYDTYLRDLIKLDGTALTHAYSTKRQKLTATHCLIN